MASPGSTNGHGKLVGIIGSATAAVGVLGTILTWVYTLQDRITRNEVALIEVETQFCAQDIVRNLMHANDLRNISILWEKEFGSPYPISNTYYPTICNRPVRK
jgi:hypothetical protein